MGRTLIIERQNRTDKECPSEIAALAYLPVFRFQGAPINLGQTVRRLILAVAVTAMQEGPLPPRMVHTTVQGQKE